ncbi:MAG: hypothetical protein OIN86_02440 [Candidatus Methanoperedens sp.]|nr:hypothetical protein [Candidatus Methanoperedens sp.]
MKKLKNHAAPVYRCGLYARCAPEKKVIASKGLKLFTPERNRSDIAEGLDESKTSDAILKSLMGTPDKCDVQYHDQN